MAKRINGEGTFRQRPNGLWEYRYSYTCNDEIKRGSAYGKTLAEVKAKAKELAARIDAERPPVDSRLTLGEWAKIWVESSLAASERKPATIALYTSLANRHVSANPIGSKRLRDVKPSVLEAYFLELKARGLAASTRRNIYAVLSDIFKIARRDHLIDRNPLESIQRPKVETKEAVFLEPDEVRALLAAAHPDNYHRDKERAFEHERNWLLLKFYALTGLRRGEALALDWFNVNLSKRRLNVRWTLSRVGKTLSRTEPKTENSRRTIDLSIEAVRVLEAVKELQKRYRVEIDGEPANEIGLVFATRTGNPVEPRSALRTIKKAARAAGIKKPVGVHTLRHSAATAMLQGGESLFKVSRYLGHESVDTTAKYYGHLFDDGLKSAAESLAAVLGV